jgi:hypothetical protein
MWLFVVKRVFLAATGAALAYVIVDRASRVRRSPRLQPARYIFDETDWAGA